MTHSIESTIWHMAFVIQYGGLFAGTVMVAALLATTFCDLIVEQMRQGRIAAPAMVRKLAGRGGAIRA